MHAIALIGLGCWVAALLNTVLNLLLVRRLRPRPSAAGEGPLVSIVIPARNEERGIEQAIRAFLKQEYGPLEIIVVNDRSSDATGPILERLSADDQRIRVVLGEPPPAGWLGKPWALEQGTRRARGELLLLVDADILYAPHAVAALVAEVRQSGVALVAVLPQVEMQGFWEHVAMPMLAVAFFTLLPSWLANRTRIPRLAVGGGAGMMVRRDAYEAAGGHAAINDYVVDDIGLARLVRKHGERTLALRADHLVRMRMYHGGSEILNGFTKNMFSALGRNYAVAAAWIAIGFFCNLLPYALAFTGDPLSLVTVGLITLTRVLMFGSLHYRLDSAILGHPLMMLFWARVLGRSMWRTGVKSQVEWRGRTYGIGG